MKSPSGLCVEADLVDVNVADAVRNRPMEGGDFGEMRRIFELCAEPIVSLSVMATIAATVGTLAVALIVSMRLTILFPALAVDAPGANAANALADTKGHASAFS